jgi:hypothetical protein
MADNRFVHHGQRRCRSEQTCCPRCKPVTNTNSDNLVAETWSSPCPSRQTEVDGQLEILVVERDNCTRQQRDFSHCCRTIDCREQLSDQYRATTTIRVHVVRQCMSGSWLSVAFVENGLASLDKPIVRRQCCDNTDKGESSIYLLSYTALVVFVGPVFVRTSDNHFTKLSTVGTSGQSRIVESATTPDMLSDKVVPRHQSDNIIHENPTLDAQQSGTNRGFVTQQVSWSTNKLLLSRRTFAR